MKDHGRAEALLIATWGAGHRRLSETDQQQEDPAEHAEVETMQESARAGDEPNNEILEEETIAVQP